MPRVIFLGTGTDVGKSHVTSALAQALASARPAHIVGALKPIETGYREEFSDAARHAKVFRNACPPDTHPLYRFADPLTPYLAADRAGAPSIDLEEIVRWVRDWEIHSQENRPATGPSSESQALSGAACGPIWTLIESAGGALSPIATRSGKVITNADLWRALEPCVAVLVARDGLGTLHDITATLDALTARVRRPDHLVLSAAGPSDPSRGTNAAVLRALGIADPIAVLEEGGSDLATLAEALIAHG